MLRAHIPGGALGVRLITLAAGRVRRFSTRHFYRAAVMMNGMIGHFPAHHSHESEILTVGSNFTWY